MIAAVIFQKINLGGSWEQIKLLNIRGKTLDSKLEPIEKQTIFNPSSMKYIQRSNI